jgi:hypothetical protein
VNEQSEALREGRRLGVRPDGPRVPITDPAAMLERVKNPGEVPPTEIHTSYEQVEGGWRCYLYIPRLTGTEIGDRLHNKTAYGQGPTKQDARDVIVGWFQEQVRNANHLTERLRVEDMMRGRRIS